MNGLDGVCAWHVKPEAGVFVFLVNRLDGLCLAGVNREAGVCVA